MYFARLKTHEKQTIRWLWEIVDLDLAVKDWWFEICIALKNRGFQLSTLQIQRKYSQIKCKWFVLCAHLPIFFKVLRKDASNVSQATKVSAAAT